MKGEYGERKREKAVNSKETLQILEEEQNKKLLQKAFVESFLNSKAFAGSFLGKLFGFAFPLLRGFFQRKDNIKKQYE